MPHASRYLLKVTFNFKGNLRVRTALAFLPLLVACSGKAGGDSATTDTADADTSTEAPATYAFTGRAGESSVAYSGQSFRQLLVHDMVLRMEGMTGRVDGGWFPARGDVAAELDFYYRFDSDSAGSVPLGFTSTPAPLQAT